MHANAEAVWRSETDVTRNSIIAALLEAGDRFVSGTDLSTQTGISRTAVWKHIQALGHLGFDIESVHRLGYRLASVPDLLLEPLLANQLPADIELGKSVLWSRTVGSTNVEALQRAAEGAPHGTLVTAQEQTGGKGRRGRVWFSPPQGLWLSLIYRQPLPLRHAAELTLLTSVAVRRALIGQTGLPIEVKWPNDLLCGGRKVCGILAEIKADGEMVQHAVIGVGINTNIPETDFPDELSPIATSLLALSGTPVSHIRLVADILTELSTLLNDLAAPQGAFRRVAEEWRAGSATLGRRIKVMTPQGLVEGMAERIDDAGVLYLRRDVGDVIPIHSGDVLF